MSVSALKQKCLSIVEQMSKQEELVEIPRFMEEIEHFRRRLQDNEFRIAVVGEFSSGKSTFINALLGKDLLQHASTETTATVTRLVNVLSSDALCGKGKVYLRNGSSIDLHNLNDLKEYTTTASETYQVVDEIEYVELYLPIFESEHRIVIVDTPGLNGTADGHREQTVSLIQQAHACIYLLQRRGLAESDITFLTYLSQIQKNFIFVQNFIDDLKTLEGDTLEDTLATQQRILNDHVFVNAPHARYSICGVSALLALTGRDESIKTLYAGSSEVLTHQQRQEIYERSRFEAFYDLLRRTFPDDKLEIMQYGDTAAALADWMRLLLEQITRRETQAIELYQASSDKRSLEKLERLKTKTLESRERHKKQLEDFILDRGRSLRVSAKESIHQELVQVMQDADKEVQGFKALAPMEEWSKRLPDILAQKINEILIRHGNRYDQQIQALYQLLLTRIEEYSSVKIDELDLNSFESSRRMSAPSSFKREMGEVDRIRKQAEAKKNEAERIEREMASLAAEADRSRHDVESAELSLRRTRSSISSRKARLGSRPACEYKEEAYTAEEYRGGLGFLDWVLGPKKVTKYRTVADDSKGEAWDRKMASEINPLIDEEYRLKKELEAAQRSERRLRAERADKEEAYQRAKKRVEELEEKARVEEETLRHKREYALKEYLVSCRKSLVAEIEHYLFGEDSVEAQISQSLEGDIKQMEEDFTRWAVERFQKAIDKKLEGIEQAKQQKYPELLKQADSLTHTKEIITKLINDLEAQLI